MLDGHDGLNGHDNFDGTSALRRIPRRRCRTLADHSLLKAMIASARIPEKCTESEDGNRLFDSVSDLPSRQRLKPHVEGLGCLDGHDGLNGHDRFDGTSA